MTVTVADLLNKIETDLAWSGPSGQQAEYVGFTRFEAQFLRDAVLTIIKERDDLLHQKEHNDGGGQEKPG